MKKVLVIEDEESIRENILDLLDAEDFEAKGAENGLVGVQLARQFCPDMILCDVMMPELDGYGVLTTLRKDPATATIPFIFLTAKADRADLRQGMSLGADDYVTKPCTPAELLSAIGIRLEKQAALDKEAQQKIEELRSNITLSLPHELRTPLNGIQGFTEILLAEYDQLEPAEVKEMLESIQSSCHRLHRLIQNFLLYAELELLATDPERIKSIRSHQNSTVKTLITDQATQQAKQANRETDLHLELQDATVLISPNRLNKLVEELLNNSFKFSSAGTPVHITGQSKNETFILSITDQGRGMTAEQIANLGAYKQFERRLYEQQGSGLGLTIALRLAELHAGKLTIQSVPDQQTTVVVTLPAVLTA